MTTTQAPVKRIGLLGGGTIGGFIARAAAERGFATVDYVVVRDAAKQRDLPAALVTERLDDALAREVDLVVEAANDTVVREAAPKVLARSDFCIFTVTSLADERFHDQVREACAKHRTRMLIPHGAVLGLDGIHDGRSVLESVTITTTKHPRNLGLDKPAEGTIFEGPTREACGKFPRNVNVHAAVAAVGIGFDRTRSVLVADPSSDRMSHVIAVRGQGLEWTIEIASRAIGAVTGAYTPVSAAGSIGRLVQNHWGVELA